MKKVFPIQNMFISYIIKDDNNKSSILSSMQIWKDGEWIGLGLSWWHGCSASVQVISYAYFLVFIHIFVLHVQIYEVTDHICMHN